MVSNFSRSSQEMLNVHFAEFNFALFFLRFIAYKVGGNSELMPVLITMVDKEL